MEGRAERERERRDSVRSSLLEADMLRSDDELGHARGAARRSSALEEIGMLRAADQQRSARLRVCFLLLLTALGGAAAVYVTWPDDSSKAVLTLAHDVGAVVNASHRSGEWVAHEVKDVVAPWIAQELNASHDAIERMAHHEFDRVALPVASPSAQPPIPALNPSPNAPILHETPPPLPSSMALPTSPAIFLA